MNDPENFLARWSRRKREVASHDVTPAEPGTVVPETPVTPPTELEAEMAALASPDVSEDKSSAPAPAFDPASLPSLDSIGAHTDIRGFLAPGVPTELAHAALRRVWTADPGIRDFKGLAEYDWDFTAPGSMLGFGDLDPGTDVKQMLADVFGELPSDPTAPAGNILTEAPPPAAAEADLPAVSESDTPEPEKIADETPAAPERIGEQQEDDLVHRNVNIAMQNNISATDEEQLVPRRQHGGALPQ